MKYIALLYGEPDTGPARGTPEFMKMLGGRGPAPDGDGARLSAAATRTLSRPTATLLPSSRARSVRRHIAGQIAVLSAAPAPTEET